MISRAAAPILGTKFEERRYYERIELTLPGRYMLSDRVEHPCWTIDVSPSGIACRSLGNGLLGERVVAYIDQIGRIEGMIARQFGECFAVTIQARAAKREKLEKKIAWAIEHAMSALSDNRQHERIGPRHRKTTLKTPDGRDYLAALIDVSIPGAALNVDAAPPIGSPVTVGHASARVVRHFKGGIAVVFDNQLSAQIFTDAVKL
ncbi:MAG TPA: PilZ domain-containing protein [Roseiarcus sp.]|nr:PilZ domain-containing protein [Roseiarcus sp.]